MAAESRFNALVHRARIGQFISVGLVGAVIETIIVALLTTTTGTTPLIAKVVGAEISISTMFAINDRWTFAEEGDVNPVAIVCRWGKSHLVRIVGLSISFSTLYLLTSGVGVSFEIIGLELWPTVANIVGIGLGLVVNYIAESLFTWEIA